MAPRDIARLCALLEGHDGLGAPRPLDAREGRLALFVPASLEAEADAALRAIAERVPLRRLGTTPVATSVSIEESRASREP